ncbi:hypothetical protein NPIL_7581 [Nephila pilipes]|uniref:Uncharacterized protein n=1 Tax=Nephila pilipes TaxID=299642 RepID=A0A8X6PB50_NEPPI|nr:hypothetical protein NPIL_7581 [Nephila pilipes]
MLRAAVFLHYIFIVPYLCFSDWIYGCILFIGRNRAFLIYSPALQMAEYFREKKRTHYETTPAFVRHFLLAGSWAFCPRPPTTWDTTLNGLHFNHSIFPLSLLLAYLFVIRMPRLFCPLVTYLN